jgi:hypothetical protein
VSAASASFSASYASAFKAIFWHAQISLVLSYGLSFFDGILLQAATTAYTHSDTGNTLFFSKGILFYVYSYPNLSFLIYKIINSPFGSALQGIRDNPIKAR